MEVTNIFLDDVRSPYKDMGYMPVNNFYKNTKWVIVRSVEEFKRVLDTTPVTSLAYISFDRDLLDLHYDFRKDFYEGTGEEALDYFLEKTKQSPELLGVKIIIHTQNGKALERMLKRLALFRMVAVATTSRNARH